MNALIEAIAQMREEDASALLPHFASMQRGGEALPRVLRKIDLLPHVDFDPAVAIANAREVKPDLAVLRPPAAAPGWRTGMPGSGSRWPRHVALARSTPRQSVSSQDG